MGNLEDKLNAEKIFRQGKLKLAGVVLEFPVIFSFRFRYQTQSMVNALLCQVSVMTKVGNKFSMMMYNLLVGCQTTYPPAVLVVGVISLFLSGDIIAGRN